MSRAKEKKAEIIDKLQEIFSSCSIGIFTDYRGLSASEVTILRNKLRESGMGFRVMKNTLARFAVERAGKDELAGFFEGPVAIAFGYGDVVEPTKILADYIRDSKASLDIKGGFFGERVLTSEDMAILSTSPSREVLIAKIMGGMQAPVLGLVSCLIAPVRGLIGVLQARSQQLGGE